MKNYTDHSRLINAVIAIIFSACFFIPFASYANANTTAKELALVEKVSINEASVKQLVTLKGIGIKKAEAIIRYRETYGSFKAIGELSKVKGIGAKVISDNKKVIII